MLATLLLLRQAPPDPHSDDSHLVAFAKLVGQLHFYIVACFAVFVWDILVRLYLPLFLLLVGTCTHAVEGGQYPQPTTAPRLNHSCATLSTHR